MFSTPYLQGLWIFLLHVVAEVDGSLLLFGLGLHLLTVITGLGVAHCREDNKFTDDDASKHAAWNSPIYNKCFCFAQ